MCATVCWSSKLTSFPLLHTNFSEFTAAAWLRLFHQAHRLYKLYLQGNHFTYSAWNKHIKNNNRCQSLLFSHITESQATKLQQWKPPSYFGLNSITKYVIREHQPPLTLMSLKPAFMCVCLLVCVLFYTVLNEYELIVDTLHFCFLIPKKPTSCDTHPLVFCCFTLMRSIIALCICNTCKCDKSVFHVRSSFCVSYSKGWK